VKTFKGVEGKQRRRGCFTCVMDDRRHGDSTKVEVRNLGGVH